MCRSIFFLIKKKYIYILSDIWQNFGLCIFLKKDTSNVHLQIKRKIKNNKDKKIRKKIVDNNEILTIID